MKTKVKTVKKIAKKSVFGTKKASKNAPKKPIMAMNPEIVEDDVLDRSPVDEDLGDVDDLEKVLKPVKKNQVVAKGSTELTSIDPVARYLNEIRKYPLLTKEQEKEVALKYFDTKDPVLAQLLVTSNLRFVVKVAAEYAKFGARLIDLIQEGNVGLMHAVRDFNPFKEVRLITYAVWWIRGYIQDYLMRQYSMVRIGTTATQRKLFYQLQKERDKLERLGFAPGVAQLSGKLDIPEDEVTEMAKRVFGRDVSLDQPASSSEGASTLGQLVEGGSDDDLATDEQLALREQIQHLKDNIESLKPNLNEKELYLLENRLLSDDPLTLQDIGDKYGITREAVRQIEAKLIQKMRVLQD